MKKIARLLAMGICVLLVTLLLRGYTAAFTAAHFPDTQPGTYWTDEDGILTVRVSDEPVQSSRAVKRYACQVSVCWNGERYAASFGQNPRAPLALTLEDGSGTAACRTAIRSGLSPPTAGRRMPRGSSPERQNSPCTV